MAEPYPLNIYHHDSLYPFESDLSPYFQAVEGCSDALDYNVLRDLCLDVESTAVSRPGSLCQDFTTEFIESGSAPITAGLELACNMRSDYFSSALQSPRRRGSYGASPGMSVRASYSPFDQGRKSSTESSSSTPHTCSGKPGEEDRRLKRREQNRRAQQSYKARKEQQECELRTKLAEAEIRCNELMRHNRCLEAMLRSRGGTGTASTKSGAYRLNVMDERPV